MADIVRTISASINSPLLSSGSINSVALTMAVNSVASANVSTFPKAGGYVRKVLSAEVIAEMAAAQKLRMTRPMKPDSTLTLQLDDERLTMNGFGVAPNIVSDATRYEQGFSIIGVDAALDAIDLSIYDYQDVYSGASPEFRPPLRLVFDPEGNRQKGDLGALIKSVTQTLIGFYPNVVEKLTGVTGSPSRLAAVQSQHQINVSLVAGWYAVLNNSSLLYPEWGTLFGLLDTLADSLIDRIMADLRSPGGFWNALMGLFAEFRVIYVPSVSGAGKILKMEDKLTLVNQTPLALNATRFAPTDGSTRLLPLGGVMVTGDTPYVMQPSEQLFGDALVGILARYPAQLGYGFTLPVPAPMWIRCGGKMALNALSDIGTGDVPSPTDPFTIAPTAVCKAAADAANKLRGKVEGGVCDGLLGPYAKAIYEEVQYADSRVRLSLSALPNEVSPGERRLFQTSDGGSFTGFVQSVNFSMSLSGDQLSVSAALEVTHVKF